MERLQDRPLWLFSYHGCCAGLPVESRVLGPLRDHHHSRRHEQGAILVQTLEPVACYETDRLILIPRYSGYRFEDIHHVGPVFASVLRGDGFGIGSALGGTDRDMLMLDFGGLAADRAAAQRWQVERSPWEPDFAPCTPGPVMP